MQLPEINFNDLNIKEIGLWPLILRLGVLAVIAIITFIVCGFIFLKDELDNLETQRAMNAAKRKEFQDKYNLAANLDAYKKQMLDIKQSYKDSLKQLPASDELPSLIEDISKQADAADLVMQSIKPSEAKPVLGFYKEMPINLELEGGYNNFGLFISDIAKIPRIITIQDFSIKSAGNTKDNGNTGDLLLDLNIKTYWLSTEASTEGEVKGAKAKSPKPSGGTPKSNHEAAKGSAPAPAPASGAKGLIGPTIQNGPEGGSTP